MFHFRIFLSAVQRVICHNVNIVCTRKIKSSIFEKHEKEKIAFELSHFAFWFRNFRGVSGHCHSLCCSCSWVPQEGQSPIQA